MLSSNGINLLHETSFWGLSSLTTLEVDSNKLVALPHCGDFLPASLIYLNLADNGLTHINKILFNNTSKLAIIYLNNNRLSRIQDDAFENCESLTDLDLSWNELSVLPTGLVGARNDSPIAYLNLGHNPFISLEGVFNNLHKLLTLLLTEVSLRSMQTSWFKDLRELKSIEFKSFDMCRYTPSVVVCLPHTDGISSITNLLNNALLAVCIWVVAVLTCVGNLMVMVCRIAFREEKNVNSLFIKNLAAADFMLGIYLLVIACHDVMYRDQYNAYAVTWMEGWTCQVAGFMGLMAIEVSVFILTCMSLECCLTVSLPLKPRLLSVSRATGVLMMMWLAGALLAAVPILFSSHFGPFYGGNGVCLPLHIHDPFTSGWQYSIFVFICVNVLGMLLIVACYVIILYSFRKTHAIVARMDGAKRREGQKHLASRMHCMDKRMFVIVLTNVLCWIPIIFIKILALLSIRIPDIFYAWLAIFVVPINSALNPIIYSLTTGNFRQKFVRLYSVEKFNSNVREFFSSLEERINNSPLALPDIMLFHNLKSAPGSLKKMNTINF